MCLRPTSSSTGHTSRQATCSNCRLPATTSKHGRRRPPRVTPCGWTTTAGSPTDSSQRQVAARPRWRTRRDTTRRKAAPTRPRGRRRPHRVGATRRAQAATSFGLLPCRLLTVGTSPPKERTCRRRPHHRASRSLELHLRYVADCRPRAGAAVSSKRRVGLLRIAQRSCLPIGRRVSVWHRKEHSEVFAVFIPAVSA
jgi:hypothetical protein